MTGTIIVEYPDAIPASLNQSRQEFEIEARHAMAAKLYELGRLTSGQAANLAGVNRADFLLSCERMGVAAVEWDENEIEAEFPAAGQS